MLKLNKIQWLKILAIYTLLACVAVGCHNIEQLLTPVRRRTFQCYDDSLNKPFINDTVPPQQLYMWGAYFPLTLIAVCETICVYMARKTSAGSSRPKLKCVLKICLVMTLFLVGLAVERLFKNVLKIKLGRLRPNFLTVCSPINKRGDTCQDLDFTFVMDDYECSSEFYPEWTIRAAFTSFPSGHTSLMSYSMIFVIYYLRVSLAKRELTRSPLLTGLIFILQTYCLFMLSFVAVSRVLDFKHHWSDVWAGFIGGCSVALMLCFYFQSQLKNIENWLEQVLACHQPENIEISQLGATNERPQSMYVIEVEAV